MLIALAILGVIGASFLGAMTTSASSVRLADERNTAKNLAEGQVEYVKKQPYAPAYTAGPIPQGFPGYSARINVTTPPSRDPNIQDIAVTISRNGHDVFTLDSFKTR